LPIFDCKEENKKAGSHRASGLCALAEMAKSRPCAENAAVLSFVSVPR